MVLPDDPETTKRNRYFLITEWVNIAAMLRAVDVLVYEQCSSHFLFYSAQT